MKRFYLSLKAKLILLIILVAVPGLAGIIYQSFMERQQAIDTAIKQAINIVELTISEQATLIKETKFFLQRLSTFNTLLNVNSSECSKTLANILKLNNNYINLGIPRTDGELLCSAKKLDHPINVADRPYIKKALTTRSFSIGEFQIDRAADVSSINFAYPVINPNSNLIEGVAVAVVSLDWWSKRLSQAKLPKKAIAYITDHEHKVIATYPQNYKVLGSIVNNYQNNLLKKNSILNQSTIRLLGADDNLRVFVNRPLSNTDDLINITISVGIPFGDELSAINSRLIQTIGVIVLFVILMFIIAIRGIQKNVLNPLKFLLHSTKNLELGKRVKDIPQHGSSELLDLQTNFNFMSKTRLNAEEQLRKSQISLQKSESRLSRHIENTPLGCISWDNNLICTEWNKAAEDIFGYSANEAIGRTAFDLILISDLHEKIYAVYKLLLEEKKATHRINDNMTKQGNTITCEWHNTPIIEKDGSVTGVSSFVQNITQRKHIEDKLTQAASVFSHAHEGIIITDASGKITDVNKTFVAITGYEHREVIGKSPNILSSNRHSQLFYTQLWKSLEENGYWSGEIWNKRKNHEIFPEHLTISTVHDHEGKVKNYVAVFTDISNIKKHQSQLEHMAHYDGLTNLPNRVLLADRLNQAMIQTKRSKKTLAIAFLDLDGFKEVNDVYGHSLGDELLILLSHRLKEALRGCDTLSRFGGDEFVAILADLDNVQDYEPVLERMLKAASKPMIVNDTLIKVSASIGVTLYPKDNVDADQLIRHADQAMYTSKQRGKNCYHLFDIESEDVIKKQSDSLQSIAEAIKNREFILYYQPKVNMKTGDIVGAEALIRWQHPQKGLLPPFNFLPLIENHPLSIEIGEWVIHEALNQIGKWQKQGLNLPVSVNIDALQLQQKDFTNRLTMLLKMHPDVKPNALQLEVLETCALGDVMDVSETMNNCLKLGISFAIDDFGTGYSSLTYLRRLPADLIKIDQTFIRDMLVDSEDKAIVVGVVALARSFNRKVIAEGVETIAHGTALLEMGCEFAQGYGIAKPMPAEKIPEWTANWKPDEAWQVVERKKPN
jgi:diguanylate cyclase (GGDEF)-like protein/PAS domain S-box-containing protein